MAFLVLGPQMCTLTPDEQSENLLEIQVPQSHSSKWVRNSECVITALQGLYHPILVMKVEARALLLLVKRSPTELHPQPSFTLYCESGSHQLTQAVSAPQVAAITGYATKCLESFFCVVWGQDPRLALNFQYSCLSPECSSIPTLRFPV